MFDTFDYENVNYKLSHHCVVEEDDDDENAENTDGLNKSSRFNFNNSDLSRLNEFVDATYNRIVNQPFEILKSSQQTDTKNKKSLKEKLFDIYLEDNTSKATSTGNIQSLNFSTHLLEKFVEREHSNTLILNFYPINKGYSLGFNIKHLTSSTDRNNNETTKAEANKTEDNSLASFNSIETKLISYDETELLYYINAGEIPPIMIDLIDRLNVNLYNDGCIILEIRDYRRFSSLVTNTAIKNYDLEFILLQPSMQTLLADLNSITNDGNFIWTQEDKYTLESQLILATAQPLCLHPSPIVSVLKHKLHNHKYKLNDRKLKKAIYKFTNVYLNRASRWSEYAMPMPFHIRKIRKKYSKTNEYLHFQTGPGATDITNSINTANNLDDKVKRQLNIPVDSTSPSSFLITSLNFQSVDNWSKSQPVFNLPREDMILVKKFAKTFDKPKLPTSAEHNLVPIEEIILEAVDRSSKNNYSKLLIKRRATDEVYFCQLGLCSDQTNEVVFRLGLANEAEKYIQQYIKIFTEEGRRAVSITKNNLAGSPNFSHSNNLGEGGSSAFTLFPPRNQQQHNAPTTSSTFQSYFNNKKSPVDFNDKQLQTYQNFFYQQQQQQKQQIQQRQQIANIQKSKQLQMQQQNQLHNQIKRIKSSNDEQNARNNLADGINTGANIIFNKNQMTKVSSSINSVTKTNKNDNNKTDPVQITTTTSSSLLKKQTSTSPPTATATESLIAMKPKQDTAQVNKPTQATTITSQSNPLAAQSSTSKTQTSNFVQIYVPKISTTSKLPKQPTTTVNSTKTSPALVPTKKTYAKKRPSSAPKATAETDEKKKQVTQVITELAVTPTAVVSSKPEQQQQALPKPISIPPPNPNPKIINASNFNLMRKIAIDSRSMPVIVTLNSAGDTNDLNHHTIQHQLKLKSQQNQQQPQTNKQIKLVNSRVTLKPAITNSTNNVTETIKNDNLQNNNASPIKTFQFQKSSPILKHLSFTYGSQNKIQGIKSTLGSNNTNILSTIPINSNNVKASTSSGSITDVVSNDGTKSFVVNSMQSQIGTQIRQGIGIQSSSSGSTSILKPSFVIKKINEKESKD